LRRCYGVTIINMHAPTRVKDYDDDDDDDETDTFYEKSECV